ncbi:MAG: hypothetical protein EOP09_11065, partial [Proteobacteria bacterium]
MILRHALILFFGVFMLVAYTNCGKSGFENALPSGTGSIFISNTSGGKALAIVGNEPNVVAITVGCGYINEP